MSFEISQERPKPKLWLAKPNKQIIQRLNGIENLSGKFNFMNENELTFNINSYVFDEKTQEQKKNPALSKIRNKYLLKFTYNGQEEWFIIDSKTDTAEEKDYIPITARYIGSELDQKQVGTVEEIGKTIRDMMNQFLPVVAKNWSVRYIDDKLASVQREYNLTDASIGSILAEISEQTDAVIVFHNKDRQLSFIHKDNAGRFRGLKVKETTYLKSFTDAQNSQDLVTRLILEGKEGLSINSINPAGTSYIDDFSYYLKPFRRDSRRNVIEHSDYMSDDLAHALLDFNEYFENRQGDYEELSENYTKLLSEQLEEDFKLSEITATLNNLEERIEVLQPIDGYAEKTVRGNTSFNVDYNMHYMMLIYNNGSLARVTFEDEEHLIMPNEYKYIKIKTPKQVDVGDELLTYPLNVLASNPNLVVGLSNSSEADFEEDDIDELDKKYNVYKYRQLYTEQYAIVASIEKRVDAYNKQRQNINESLSAQNFFTPQLQEELENFTHWGIWREENHTDPKELLEDGRKQLSERNNIDRTTTVNIIDFVQSLDPEDQKNWDKLVAGDKIRFSSETYEADLEAFISELNINFDDNDVSLTLSDVIDLRDKARGASQVLASFVSTSNQVNMQKKQLDENAGKTNQVMALLEAEWDANKRRILAGNETVDIGSHGIRITSPTHPNEMLVAVAGVISISDDYGETFKQAINTRGVVAERLIGKVILGTELIMENNSGTFRFDDDGVRINAEHFHLIADDGQDYFDNLLRQLEQEFVTYEERIKADMEQQEESFKNEMGDVAEGITEYTNSLLDALADGMLTEQEINMLKMQMNMLEADYAQARRRIIPIVQSTDVDPNLQNQLYLLFMEFEEDYEKLLSFIRDLDDPIEVSPETIDGAKDFLLNFKPNIEEIISLAEMNLEAIQNNRIANAEYNSRTFTENLVHDLEDEIGDLNEALEGFDLGFEGAIADGVLDMIERANISDALLRVESEKANVDNRYAFLSVHKYIVNTDQLRKLQNAKQEYNAAFNTLINRINYILAREKITPEMVSDYREAMQGFSDQIVIYSQVYEESLEFVQNRYADTQRGEAEKYADGLKLEVDSDIQDVHDNIGNFAEDVYGAFADGIITERERARLQIHHDMLEKEKSDVIERYNTIITSQYLQGFYDTEALVQARARYGEIHADLLLNLELAMMDDKITKEEADQAVANFEEYVERLTAFSVELELAIAALGESKAVYQTKEELRNYIELSVFNDEIAQMQSTLDGHIMTWYYDHEPTLNNEPAVNWTDSATRERHVGDLFYYGEEGFAYRFMKKPGGGFEWIVIKDNDITKALADAQDAIDLADSKRRVFVANPTPPYDIGDLWIMGDGELMRARRARKEGEVFLEGDWILATKYTDDTKANAVENMLNDFQEAVNDEFEDLVGTFDAFKKTIEGAFKDGIIEDYELKILHVQAQSLDREKADVDALYNQLLNRSELNSSERSTLVNRYSSFSSTHMSLINNLKQVIEDGVIDETEYNIIMTALDDYPVALRSIKEYMNEVLNNIIERVSGAVNDIANKLRFDEWETTSFATEAGRIASMVSESSWEETYLPIVNKNIAGLGSENLVPYADIVNYLSEWRTSASGSSSAQIYQTSSGNAVYDRTARVYTSNINDGDYFAIRSKPLVKEVVEKETYTLSFKTTNHASSDTDMTYTYLINEAPGTTNQGSFKMNTVNTTRADGVLAYHHTITFQARFSGAASLLIGTRSTSDVGSQFHIYDLMFVKGTVVPEWSSSPMDSVEDLHNNVIKRDYSTTEQTKGLISSEVNSYNLSGYLDKLSSGYSEHDVSNTEWSEITEANGSLMDDAFSYEITARRKTNDDTLFVAVFNSRGRGNGWDRVILEQKGTTGFHPQVYNWSRGIRIRTYGGSTLYAMQVVYQKYAGSFTNLDWANSQIKQTKDEINLRVTNKTIGGGKNMIPYSSFPEDEDEWSTQYSSAQILQDNVTNHLQDFAWVHLSASADGTSMTISTPRFNVVSGRTLTLSFKATRFWNCHDDMRYIAWIPIGQSNQSVATPVKTELVTDDSFSDTLNHYEVQTTPNFSGEAYLIIGTRRIDTASASRFYIKDVKLEEGVTSTAWSPSPNDSLERYSEIKTTAENISLTVSKKVGEDEIISKINQSAESVSINANKISLTAGSPIDEAIQNSSHPNPNMIKMSNFWNYPNELFYENYVLSNIDSSESGLFTSPEFGRGWVKMMHSSISSSSGLTYMWTQNSGRNRFSLTSGQEYTFSILVAQNSSIQFNYCYIREITGGTSQINLATNSSVKRTRILVGRTYGRDVYKYIFTFTPNFGGKNAFMFFGFSNKNETTKGYYLSEWKLEAGDQASPYVEDYASKDYIIAAINMDKSGTRISGDKVSVSAEDIELDGKTIDIGSNSAITSLRQQVGTVEGIANAAEGAAETARGEASEADSAAKAAKDQADAARVGNNIANSLNSSETTVNIAADRINLSGYATFSSLSTAGSSTIHGDNITTGRLTSSNGRTTFNLNTGSLTMSNANFELGGGATIEFTGDTNKVVYNINSWSAGLGVTRSINNRYPVTYMGVGEGILGATDSVDFSGFIANSNSREAEDSIGNSVVGNRFHVRNRTDSVNKGFLFNVKNNIPYFSPMNSGTYDYYLGTENNPFDWGYIGSISSGRDWFTLNYAYDGSRVGYRFELTSSASSGNHAFRPQWGGELYYNLGTSTHVWRRGYINVLHYNQLSQNSLRELKEDIEEFNVNDAKEFIKTSNIYTYSYKQETDKNYEKSDYDKKVGIIYDEISCKNDHLIKSGEGTIDQSNIIFMVQSVVKDNMETIENQEKDLKRLEKDNMELRSRLDRIEEMLLK